MNVNQQRNSNIVLCYSLIFLGFLCILGTTVLTVYLKDGIIERVREPQSLENISKPIEINSIERQIESKERQIEIAKSMSDHDKILREAREKLNIKSGNKNSSDTNSSNFEQDKAAKVKLLEDEKAQLIIKRDDLAGKMRAVNARSRTWSEWFDDYNIELLVSAVLPLGIFGFYLMRLTLFGRLPKRNPFALTDFEKRSILFLPSAIVFSAFGFFHFVWILTIYY